MALSTSARAVHTCSSSAGYPPSSASASSSCSRNAYLQRPMHESYFPRAAHSHVGRIFWSCQQGRTKLVQGFGNRGRHGRGGWSFPLPLPGCNAASNDGRPASDVVNQDYVYNMDPPWIWGIKVIYRSMRELLEFLWEQPGQLKYIEFTPWDSVVKMAFLTLVVVIILIIFLSTVDSALSYILAKILRKVP